MPSARIRTTRTRWTAIAGLLLLGALLRADDTLVRTEGPRDLLPLASAFRNAWRLESEDLEMSLGAGLSEKARLDALAAGGIDVAFAGHGLDLDDVRARGMTAHRLGVVAVVFAVHADVTVLNLKPTDVCDIFAGRVTTWDGYGGPPTPIHPVLRPQTEADTEVARAAIPCLKNLVPGPSVTVARTTSDMRVALQSTPGAIGLTTLAAVRQSIVAVRALSLGSVAPTPANVLNGRYPLVRPAYLVTPVKPSPLALRFLAFARSEKGAAALAEAGLLPAP